MRERREAEDPRVELARRTLETYVGDGAGHGTTPDASALLGTPEPVDSTDALDCRRNGVIVSTVDGQRGLLLPDLDGMNTIDEQLRIAARKGGVGLGSDRVCLERFTVTRHV